MAANPTFQPSSTATGFPALAQSLTKLIPLRGVVDQWLHRAHFRRELSRLDDRLLRDIGFDPSLARDEADRPFWQPYALARNLAG